MNYEKAVEKVKKCLALAQSNNIHEANQAKKHAEALMRKYKITSIDIENSDIKHVRSEKTYTKNDWRNYLVSIVGRAFLVIPVNYGSKILWYGKDNNPELAEYVFEVLYRQCKQERENFIKEALNLTRIKAMKTARANKYALYWCYGVQKSIEAFITSTEDEYTDLQQTVRNLAKTKTKKKTPSKSRYQKAAEKRYNDGSLGYKAGSQVKILKPLHQKYKQQSLLD